MQYFYWDNPKKIWVADSQHNTFGFRAKEFGTTQMPNNQDKDQISEDVAQFSGAMDALVSKYDEIINEFTDILDKQTKKIFSDPKLDETD